MPSKIQERTQHLTRIGRCMWSWPVIGASLGLLWGAGITFMTTSHPSLANVFYALGTLLFIVKFLTWEELRRQPRRQRRVVSWVVIPLLLMTTSFAVWGNGRLNATQTVTPPAPLEKPDLSWAKDHAIGSTFNPRQPGDVLIVWVGLIENRGGISSTTSNWRLEVILPGKSTPQDAELLPPRGQNLSAWYGFPMATGTQDIFNWKNYLPELTARTPITMGKPALGFVAFIVRGIPAGQLVKSTRLILSFDDAVGKTVRADVDLDEPLPSMPYIPGLLP